MATPPPTTHIYTRVLAATICNTATVAHATTTTLPCVCVRVCVWIMRS